MSVLPRLVLALVLVALGVAPAAAAPKVAVSIVPLHALVAAVMEGVGTPDLIVKGIVSEHAYALKPSDARLLRDARIVFWIGPELETYLVKPIAALRPGAISVALLTAPGLRTLPRRAGGAFEADHDHGTDQHPDAPDPHVWLDPANARAIMDQAAAALAATDPANGARYRANADRAGAALTELDGELRRALTPLAARPFIVFHDAYQYLEARYGLTAAGAITVDPDRKPSARRVAALRARIKEKDARCVFAEPQFAPAIARTLTEGTGATLGILDPIGAGLAPGPAAYPALMRGLAAALTACLGR